jgi:hypothetical protein
MPCLGTHTRRLLAGLVAVTLTAALAVVPAALAARDPVRVGSFHLRLSDAFKKQLSRHGVSMTPKSFEIRGGAIDPITGNGLLKLRGRLTFKHGDEKLPFKRVTATLGSGGVLKAGGVKLFRLGGGTVSRNGFGANIKGIRLTFLKGAAKGLNRKLGLSSLRRGTAGSLSVSAQPQTVEVVSGTTSVEPALGAGSVSSKLAAHCVDPNSGVSVIAPGMQPGGPGTTFFFPVSFGTISPIGADGVVQQAGGLQLANGGAGLPPDCPASNNLTIRLSDFSADLLHRTVSAHVAISGSGSPLGDLDAAIIFPLDISDAWVNADPFNLAVASNGTAIRLNPFAAATLNLLLPQPSPADPNMQFADGDLFGISGISVAVR